MWLLFFQFFLVFFVLFIQLSSYRAFSPNFCFKLQGFQFYQHFMSRFLNRTFLHSFGGLWQRLNCLKVCCNFWLCALLSRVGHTNLVTKTALHFLYQAYCTREHWTGEVSADEWLPVFPVFNWPLVLWKKYFVFIKMTYSRRYAFAACNSRYA